MSQPMANVVRVRIEIDRADGTTDMVEVVSQDRNQVKAGVTLSQPSPMDEVTMFGLQEVTRPYQLPRMQVELTSIGGTVTVHAPRPTAR